MLVLPLGQPPTLGMYRAMRCASFDIGIVRNRTAPGSRSVEVNKAHARSSQLLQNEVLANAARIGPKKGHLPIRNLLFTIGVPTRMQAFYRITASLDRAQNEIESLHLSPRQVSKRIQPASVWLLSEVKS